MLVLYHITPRVRFSEEHLGKAYQHADPGPQPWVGQLPHGNMVVTGTLSVREQYPTAGDRAVAVRHGVPEAQVNVLTWYPSALRMDREETIQHTTIEGVVATNARDILILAHRKLRCRYHESR